MRVSFHGMLFCPDRGVSQLLTSRSLFCYKVVAPHTGRVYWTNADGDIIEYDADVTTESHQGGLLRVLVSGSNGGLCRQ